MVILSLVMLGLLAVEFLVPLTPDQHRMVILTEWLIWVIFILQFAVMFSLAPNKGRYLRRNWLTVVSLLIPYLRIFRIVRAFKAIRLLTVARLVTLTNRALRQLGLVLQARRILFVAFSTIIVDFISAAGMYFLERGAPGTAIDSFGTALWFTTRSVMNADVPIAPVTPEGRFLGVLISLYGFAIFGIITAALASLFIHNDQRRELREQHLTQKESTEITDKIREDLESRPTSDADLRVRIDYLISLLEAREQRKPPPRNAT
ncbi:MAG: ion transporter [Armatimonadota bacterium]